MSGIADKVHHKRLPKWEAFDRIELDVVPRYKTSGLSGDEWRTSVRIRFSFKNAVVYEWQTRDMETAIMLLGHEWMRAQEPIPSEVIQRERGLCDQPGCHAPAANRYVITSLFSERGDRLDAADQHLRYYRAFCEEHAERGDCSREDCDANYTRMPEPR